MLRKLLTWSTKPGIPVVEAAAMHGARHVVLVQIGRHGGAEDVHPAIHQRMRIERDRVAERRNPDARREGRGLVMVVEDLRVIFEIGLA